MKALTVRLRDDDLARELEFVARVDGVTLSALIQISIKAYIHGRLRDPTFMARASALVQEDQSRITTTSPGDRGKEPNTYRRTDQGDS